MKLHVDDRNPDGRGRGHLGGRVVLVSQAHPGEDVLVHVDRQSAGVVQGRVERLISADPRRIDHACAHEFACTGCPLLAVHPADEAAFKRGKVIQAFEGQGVRETVVGAMTTPNGPFGYRHYAKQVFVRRQGQVVLGSYVASTHDVADNTACPVLVPELAQLLAAVRQAVQDTGVRLAEATAGTAGLRYAVARQSHASRNQLLVLVTSADDPAAEVAVCESLHAMLPKLVGAHVVVNREPGNALLHGELLPVSGAASLDDEMLGFEHRIDARAFFQINPVAAAALFQAALDGAGRGQRCVEGYAGVGALTLPLARQFAQVLAVEDNPAAVAALRLTAERYGLDGITAQAARAEIALPQLVATSRPEVVVVDPPRKGLGERLARAIAAGAPQRVVLLSCDPETLRRDLPPLVAGGFRVQRVVPVDQFPRTAHVETVTVLQRS